MHCNFRSLRVDAEVVYWHALKLRHGPRAPFLATTGRRRPEEAQALEHLQGVFRGEGLPDLEQEVTRRSGAGASKVQAVLRQCGDALEAVARSRLVLMDTCRIDEAGRVLVGVSLPGTAHPVRAGDDLLSGAYLRADLASDAASIGARFVRPARWSAFALPGRRVDPEAAVSRILRSSATRRVSGIVQTLQRVTWTPVEGPIDALATLGIHIPPDEQEALGRLFDRGRDRTLYGAVGALADLGRRARSLDRQWQLERLAGDAVRACIPLADPRSMRADDERFAEPTHPRAGADPA